MGEPHGITEAQFMRGMGAVARYRTMVGAMQKAGEAGGLQRIDGHHGDALLDELTSQMSERCRDDDGGSGTFIEYMLYDCGGPVTVPGGKSYMVNTPELLWAYWQETETGPFAP